MTTHHSPATDTKSVTDGPDPKVAIQAVVAALVAILAYFGLNLDPELAGAIGVLLGIVAAVLGPAARTRVVQR